MRNWYLFENHELPLSLCSDISTWKWYAWCKFFCPSSLEHVALFLEMFCFLLTTRGWFEPNELLLNNQICFKAYQPTSFFTKSIKLTEHDEHSSYYSYPSHETKSGLSQGSTFDIFGFVWYTRVCYGFAWFLRILATCLTTFVFMSRFKIHILDWHGNNNQLWRYF